jgi:hypothetical protein
MGEGDPGRLPASTTIKIAATGSDRTSITLNKRFIMAS